VLLPLGDVLLASDWGLDLLQGLRQEDVVAASAVGVAGALQSVFADPAGRFGEQVGQSFVPPSRPR
jgi:hypothetical protein